MILVGNNSHTWAYVAGVMIAPPSSRRFKQDIEDMAERSDALMRLRPVTFRYKEAYDAAADRLQYGLIAEEVAQVYPELVVSDEAGQARTVEYLKLPALLLNELQSQHRKLQEQAAVIADLEGQTAVIADLQERLLRMEQALMTQSRP